MLHARQARHVVCLITALLSTVSLRGESIAADTSARSVVKFNRDVRPILSDKCFQCHGPDAKKREADLRLDDRAVALETKAIVPGGPSDSLLIQRIICGDEEQRMPPAESKLERLSEAEIATLRDWIEQGAEYENHWSFIPLRPIEIPSGYAGSPIDALVSEGLKQFGVELQPEASRTTLIRRLSFDLTGLPPTADEVDAFLNDHSEDAYEKLVDRLLASERFGERMAVDWLDVARYADSYGFQVDLPSTVWPWRDWVIESFNANMPFDQFITWQLAGDLLPNPEPKQILATAFNRLHQQESEGGSVEEEYRVEYVCDRVQTFATTFLGLTMECCRCHDHKYDPLLQRDYYQLFAMFQNIDEAGLYSYSPSTSVPTPTLGLIDDATKAKRSEAEAQVAAAEAHLAELRKGRQEPFRKWLAERLSSSSASGMPTEESGGEPSAKIAGEVARFRFDTAEKDKLPDDVHEGRSSELHGGNQLVPGRYGNAVKFTGDDSMSIPLGKFERHEPFSISFWLQTPDFKDRAVVCHCSDSWTDSGSRGYELLIENGRLKWSLIHFWPGNAASIIAVDPVPLGEWVHVTVTSDGSSRASGLQLYVNGQPAKTERVKDQLTKEITFAKIKGISLGERTRDRGFKEGLLDELRIFERELTPLEVLQIADAQAAEAVLTREDAQLSDAERSLLYDYYLFTADEEWRGGLDALKASRAAYEKIADSVDEIMVMRELPEPKKAFVLFRGEYAERRDEVQAGTPAALPSMAADAPHNRMGLARWLTDPGHPLTARVTVNRVWQSLFGRGLVATAENFGSQGARPLYPEVLDHLALNFINSGWDTKQLIKTIVTSRTYRQRSIADPKTMADDPDNERLARGPRVRLPAEMIRDNALAASGLLRNQLGGPSVNPYEMSEAFKPAKPTKDGGVYRRSLYTNWRRTGPPPAMVAFDAPRRAVCTARRERTDSPLQALILLNGVQFVEAARVLGSSLHRDASGDVTAMVEQGCLRCLSRRPDEREAEILSRLYHEQLAHFTAHPDEAAELLGIGDADRDDSIDAAHAAAATILVQTLMNHDECVVKR